jgi:hypothetical protein
MRRFTWIFAFVLTAGALAATSALAASVHFKKPAPTFTKNSDLSLTSSGQLAGLGNGDVLVTIQATGTGGAKCQNPGGNSKVPGQNPVAVNVSGSVFIPSSQLSNGNVPYTVSTVAPPVPSPEQAGCPNDSWSVVDFNVTYTSATITVFQDSNGQNGIFDAPGTQVLTQTFTFSPPK